MPEKRKTPRFFHNLFYCILLSVQFQEQLDECKKYKDFILSLTPKDWVDANAHIPGEHFKKNNDPKETGDMVSGGDNFVKSFKDYINFLT